MKRALSRMFSVASAFIIFGIIDNGVMVMAGSVIDKFLGDTFGLSTMAAAGFGNTLSDLVGIIGGRYIEKRLFKTLITDTEEMSPKRIILAEAIGITIGCMIGMIPLLFM